MIIIYGPTATGKTDLAITLAKKYKGELISADSRQVYKGLDIGTGKVNFSSKVEKHNGFWIVDGVKIRGFDLVEPGSRSETFTAADFIKFANSSIVQTIELKKMPIVVGGTGFYIKGLLKPIDSIGIQPNLKLRKLLGKLSQHQLYKKLEEVDPRKAKSMNDSDRKNPRRLIRAIEIAMYNQKSLFARKHTKSKQLKNQNENLKFKIENYLLIGLTAPNGYLYQRADDWLEKRLKMGMIEEVKNLMEEGINPDWLESLGLEYRWVIRFVLGQIGHDQAAVRLKGDIHNFIRRQKTFFRQFANFNLQIFDISKINWQSKLEKTVRSWYISSTPDIYVRLRCGASLIYTQKDGARKTGYTS